MKAFRLSCGNLQTHGPGRSPRLPGPSVPKPSRSSSNSIPPLHREKTRAALHSQKDSSECRDNGGGVRIRRNSLSRSGTENAAAARPRSVDQREKRTTRLPSRRDHRGLPISAVFRLRYCHDFRRGGGPPRSTGPDGAPLGQSWLGCASGKMVFGANGDPTIRFGFAGRARCCGGRDLSRARQLRFLQQIRQPGRSEIRRVLEPPGRGLW